MESLLHEIIALLLAIGPWVVFAVTAIETAGFIGLVVPAEATVLVAAFLADRGYFPVAEILAATILGGFLGDQVGYLLGRFGGAKIAARDGRLGRVWRRYEAAATSLFRRHSGLAVTLARFISFVRTLMPWFAGMGRMPYGRFLAYDLLGVLGWGVGSVALGYIAGESWHYVAGALGTAGGVSVAVLAVFLAVLAYRGRRKLMETVEGDGAAAGVALPSAAIAEASPRGSG